jgi:hypothetical protein
MDVKLENVLEVPSVLKVAQIDIHTSELHPMPKIIRVVIFCTLTRGKVLLVSKVIRLDFFSKGVLEKEDEEGKKNDVDVNLE